MRLFDCRFVRSFGTILTATIIPSFQKRCFIKKKANFNALVVGLYEKVEFRNVIALKDFKNLCLLFNYVIQLYCFFSLGDIYYF